MSGLTIRLLGTSAARPVPHWGCVCSQCSDARMNPRGTRTRSSILVDGRILVDPGPDIYRQLSGLPPAELAVIHDVIITHPHADHYLGLDDLAELRALTQLEQIPVWSQFDSWTLILVTFGYLVSHDLDPSVKRPFVRRDMMLGQSFELGKGLTFTPFDTFHTSTFSTAGLVIEQKDLRVVYAPDFYDSSFLGLIEPDLLILDGTFLDVDQHGYVPDMAEGHGRHLPIVEGIRFAQAIRARRTLFTHIGHVGCSVDELNEYFPNDTFDVAYDGQLVEVTA
jgi:phosphoribosyl 1,2-cyclic phosphate phosphodiesterase